MGEKEMEGDLEGEELEMAEDEAGMAPELEGKMPEGEGLPELADIDDEMLLQEAMTRGLLPKDFALEGMGEEDMEEGEEFEDEELPMEEDEEY